MRQKIITTEIAAEQINLIKFCEQWNWDEEGKLIKKVLAYAPVHERDER